MRGSDTGDLWWKNAVFYCADVETFYDWNGDGTGDIRGVIASESANNAREGGALVPTIAFGVPGTATMALLISAFLVHGLQPGPDMLGKNLPPLPHQSCVRWSAFQNL